MANHKPKFTPLGRYWCPTASIAAATVLLASLAACSQAPPSAQAENQVDAKADSLVSDHPFGDKTPAQRRAAWLKRKWSTQPTESVAQNAGTAPQTARN